MTEFSTYQNSLIPLLLDSFEIYKLALKNNEKTKKYCENLLIKLYLQFNPEAISRVILGYLFFLNCYVFIKKKRSPQLQSMK